MFKYSMTESIQWNYCWANTNELRKRDVIKVCSIEYFDLVSRRAHKLPQRVRTESGRQEYFGAF